MARERSWTANTQKKGKATKQPSPKTTTRKNTTRLFKTNHSEKMKFAQAFTNVCNIPRLSLHLQQTSEIALNDKEAECLDKKSNFARDSTFWTKRFHYDFIDCIHKIPCLFELPLPPHVFMYPLECCPRAGSGIPHNQATSGSPNLHLAKPRREE